MCCAWCDERIAQGIARKVKVKALGTISEDINTAIDNYPEWGWKKTKTHLWQVQRKANLQAKVIEAAKKVVSYHNLLEIEGRWPSPSEKALIAAIVELERTKNE